MFTNLQTGNCRTYQLEAAPSTAENHQPRRSLLAAVATAADGRKRLSQQERIYRQSSLDHSGGSNNALEHHPHGHATSIAFSLFQL